MTPEAWTVNLGALLGAFFAAWQATRAATAARSAKRTTEDVRELAAPTGDGFAQQVLSKLDAITASQADLTRRLDRLEDAVALHVQVHSMIDRR